MNPLYAMFIYPLELIYHFVYSLCYTITGNYGVGLIVLSCLAAIGYLPLGRLAVKAQHKEKQLSALIKPKLDKIKAEETDGSKRQLRTSNLYKKYRYHPFLAIRSAFGVILQLPFLLGAYYMISNFTALKGQSFLFTSDLSKPDGLLGGVNFLPFLMTAINICTTLIIPKLSIKDRTQAFIIAGGFLWLLYSAPSALLFFWTTNNLIFFVQNLIVRVKLGEKEIKSIDRKKNLTKILNLPFKLPLIAEKIIKIILISGGLTCLYTVFLSAFLLKQSLTDWGKASTSVVMPDSIFIALILAIIITSLIFILKNNQNISKTIIQIGYLLFLWIPVAIIYIHLIETRSILFLTTTHLFLYIYIFFGLFSTVFFIFRKQQLNKFLQSFFQNKSTQTFFLTTGLLTILFFFFTTVTIYKSDPSYFDESILAICSKIFPFAIIGLTCICLLWQLSSTFIRNITTFILFTVLIFFLTCLFIFKGNYGTLDFTLLSNTNYFFSPNAFINDIFIFFTVSIFFTTIFYFRLTQFVFSGLSILFISLSFLTFFNILVITNQDKALQEQLNNDEKKIHDFFAYHPTKENIVYFIFDMFDSRDIPVVFDRNPELKEKFTGFTWYKNTTSIGENTVLSLPSIYGGYDYTPQNINKKNKSLRTEVNNAFTQLPNLFSKKGFSVALNYPDQGAFMGSNYFYSKIKDKKNVLLLNLNPKLSSFYKDFSSSNEQSKILKYHPFFLSVSLFNIVPHFLRSYIYQNGTWLGSAKSINTNNTTYKDLAMLKMNTEFANINAEKQTFKFFYSMLSHFPWNLKENELVTTDQEQLQLYTAEHIMKYLAEYIDWLKNNGIYDNTKIVIASDHDGIAEKIAGYDFPLNVPGKPFSILFFKDFNSIKSFDINTDPMTSADAYYLIKKDIFEQEDVPNKDIRQHLSSVHASFPRHPRKKYLYTTYEVEGDMWDEKNWKQTNK
ncbi:MAG: YidC/Oxa1 family membrane protein insertase [Treponemataceae bacterium]